MGCSQAKSRTCGKGLGKGGGGKEGKKQKAKKQKPVKGGWRMGVAGSGAHRQEKTERVRTPRGSEGNRDYPRRREHGLEKCEGGWENFPKNLPKNLTHKGWERKTGTRGNHTEVLVKKPRG